MPTAMPEMIPMIKQVWQGWWEVTDVNIGQVLERSWKKEGLKIKQMNRLEKLKARYIDRLMRRKGVTISPEQTDEMFTEWLNGLTNSQLLEELDYLDYLTEIEKQLK